MAHVGCPRGRGRGAPRAAPLFFVSAPRRGLPLPRPQAAPKGQSKAFIPTKKTDQTPTSKSKAKAKTGPAPGSPAPSLSADLRAARAQGREEYAPDTFEVLIDDAIVAMGFAMADGDNRMEVQFPSVNVDGYKGASDSFIDANIQLAISAARKIAARDGMKVILLACSLPCSLPTLTPFAPPSPLSPS